MKTYIDKSKLTEQMADKGYKTYASLCRDAGVNVSTFNSVVYQKQSSLNMSYLLADCLGCHIDDIVSVDWEA